MKRALLDRVLDARRARRTFVVATRLADGHQELLLQDDPASTAAPPTSPLQAAAEAALAADQADTVELPDGAWLIAPHHPPLRLLVVGAVHISQALVPLAKVLDLEVVVIDPRRSWGTPERFPDVRLVHAWPEPAFAELGLDPRSAVITLTHDRKLDDPAIAAALASPVFYIGALGSRKTQAARAERLRERFDEATLARVHGPVGLAIGARSPAEIALSILAEVIAARRGADPKAPPAS